MRIENIKNKYLIIVGILLLITWFYWFQYRPASIRSYCYHQASEKAKLTTEKSSLLDIYYPSKEPNDKISINEYKFRYESCLNEKGLK